MLLRVVALAFLLAVLPSARAQQAVPTGAEDWVKPSQSATAAPESAWLDLRQIESSHATTQAAPSWVESVSFNSTQTQPEAPAHSVFRIRIVRPNEDCQILLFRLFFDDDPRQQPELVAWDESGSQVLRSGSLGEGTGLPTSTSSIVPMIGVTAIDLEVPGNGRSVRGAYLDWMKTTTVMHPIHSEQRDLMPEPFAAAAPLRTKGEDSEIYGTVTAPLAPGTIPLEPSVEKSGRFQFELESQPLVALLSFELASPQIDAAPEIYINGADLGAVSLVLPDLADPAYRGVSRALLDDMKFQYTGWIRSQITVPGSALKAGTNDVIVMAAAGTPKSAIRATQIQLKYLWDKSDYLLLPLK
ncbi:MAG: hypothetical protein H0X34_12620 [Chthoniobacterales bacterium]|nr:hypothetical protein [Chthoniobacterales bacterium]